MDGDFSPAETPGVSQLRHNSSVATTECLCCGFEQSEQAEWDTVEDPTLAELTACPECGSTNVMSGREIT